MMNIRHLVLGTVVVLGLTGTAAAQQQQQPDPADLQRLVNELRSQRNSAQDQNAALGAHIIKLTAEKDQLAARLKETEAKLKETAGTKPPGSQ
jgi:peptidoglycan hydrolase CwlO-like protein